MSGVYLLTVFCLTAVDGGSVAPWCAPKSVSGASNSLDIFDWIIFVSAFERTFLDVETVGCLVRFASESAVWFIAALVNLSGIRIQYATNTSAPFSSHDKGSTWLQWLEQARRGREVIQKTGPSRRLEHSTAHT